MQENDRFHTPELHHRRVLTAAEVRTLEEDQPVFRLVLCHQDQNQYHR